MTESTAVAIMAEDVKLQAEAMTTHAPALFGANINPLQAVELARLAVTYGLDPFAGELTLYQGKPLVTLAGWTRVANDNPMYDGMEAEPASESVRKALGVADTEHLWVARVYRKDRSRPATAFGRAGGPNDRNAVSKTHTWEIARKRAIVRAMREAMNLRLPYAPADDATDYAAEYEGPRITVEAPPVNHDERNRLLAEIHITAKALGWSEAYYRDVIASNYGGIVSAADLDPDQLLDFAGRLAHILASREEEKAQTPADAVEQAAQLGMYDDAPAPEMHDIAPEMHDIAPEMHKMHDEEMATKDQILAIKQLLMRAQRGKEINDTPWDTITYREAAEWLTRLQAPQ